MNISQLIDKAWEAINRYCRVRSLMQVLLVQRSILGERTMHID
jgi:hypothetical protein